jgi:polar amino acid transport system ATP-binding protein
VSAANKHPIDIATSNAANLEDAIGPGGDLAARRPMIRFDSVGKTFGDHAVLRDLELEVDDGRKVALIGPSGSGKTTILRMLMTLERPDTGTIYVDGDPLWHMRRNGRLVSADERHLRRMRMKIGMVFQQFNLFPHMTVLRNVAEAPVRVLGLPRAEAEEAAHDLLDRVGLAGTAGQRPSQLSGGQQQRVAIARAIAMRPKVMLFDEVTSALDPELVTEVHAVLRDLATETGMTMLLVTHEMNFARDIADHVLVFDKGHIIEKGPPGQIFTQPRNERTQEFLRAILEAT